MGGGGFRAAMADWTTTTLVELSRVIRVKYHNGRVDRNIGFFGN
jgi:hypothetical protein